jgi:Tfp pilus assembly protein PilF
MKFQFKAGRVPRRHARIATLFCLLSGSLAAQFGPGWSAHESISVRGQISAEHGVTAFDGLQVELSPLMGAGAIVRAPVSLAGDFTFDRVPAGDYQLKVTNLFGTVIYQEFASIRETSFLTVRLPEARVERPVSGTVSVGDLKRKTDPRAHKEFRKAHKAAEKGDIQKSIEHLQKAIAADPAYMEAYNNLGSRYLELKQFDLAIDELEKARHLSPDSALVNANLAYAYFLVERCADAERRARNALQSDPNSKKASLLLGLSLKAQDTGLEEALYSLQRAAPEFPKARLLAAEILARQGDHAAAAHEVERYLKSGSVDDREQVEAWLAELQTIEARR